VTELLKAKVARRRFAATEIWESKEHPIPNIRFEHPNANIQFPMKLQNSKSKLQAETSMFKIQGAHLDSTTSSA
jgi:hypothetical protein